MAASTREQVNTLQGRTYFVPKRTGTGKSSSDSSDEEIEESTNQTEQADTYGTSYQSRSASYQYYSDSSDTRPRTQIYQRPWCPGQLMATLVPHAMSPLYDWTDPQTCTQFASNYGGVSVLVGELGGPDFCSAGPVTVYSNYTITRGMSVNEAVYARKLVGGTEYAVAAGPIMYPQGNIMYISVAKEVAKLPQVCNRRLY